MDISLGLLSSTWKLLFAIVHDEPHHCTYTNRYRTFGTIYKQTTYRITFSSTSIDDLL